MEIYNDVLWGYKSFNMANELDVAGEFIYDGIQALNEMSCIEESASLFSFLYHISVGIERLQKIIIVLCEKITFDDFEEFEKRLVTHSHSELGERIAKYMTVKLNPRENEFLQVLTVFYKKARYNRFSVVSRECEEEKALSRFVEKYSDNNRLQYSLVTNKIIVDENIRELIGRIVGNLSKKYYAFLKEKAHENNTYSYELRVYSKAEKIFLSNSRKNSLQNLKITEMTVLKEFLVYFRNTKASSALLRYIENIKPLDIDVDLLNESISELALGNVPMTLIDEVETLYEENEYSINRMREVGAIGDPEILFEIVDVVNCIDRIESYISVSSQNDDIAINIINEIEQNSSERLWIDFCDVIELCEKYIDKLLSRQEFVNGVSNALLELKCIYDLCDVECNEE